MLLRQAILCSFLCLLTVKGTSQPGGYAVSRSFTVADGLPSNHIYSCVEDDKGFLWIATDAGIARFDGRNFQVFTTRHGLPDDEVLSVVKENNGRIWVNCFKQSPAYFDETRNRFVNVNEDSGPGRPQGANLIHLSALAKGGVMYNNEKGCYIFENNKFHFFTVPFNGSFSAVTIQRFDDGSFISLLNNAAERTCWLVKVKDNTITDRLLITRRSKPMELKYFLGNNKFFLLNENRTGYHIISDISSNPLRCTIDSLEVTGGEQIIWQQSSAGFFNVIGKGGKTFVFDEQTLKPVLQLRGNYAPNAAYHDRAGNIWVSSIDKGLFLYKKRTIRVLPVTHGFSNNFFLSIARKPNGAILAGNYFGQVVEFSGNDFIIHKLPENGLSTSWQRKILVSQNKVYTFSEGGSYIDYREQIGLANGYPLYSKTAAVINDSLLVEGSYGILRYIHTKTGKITPLQGLYKRATCLSVAPGPMIYHGSTDGLYKYDCIKGIDIDLTVSNAGLAERITALCTTADGLVWVGTASKGVLCLSGDSLVRTFSTACGMTSNNVKCITEGRPGELWVGTTAGISIIRYREKNIDPACHNLSPCDGLSSNIINEMIFSNDTMYCATANGVSAVAAGIDIPTFDIPVQLIAVQVNNRDTSVTSAYRLRYEDNNLSLRFAGVELGGHFSHFQYKVGKGNWIDLEGNTLDLQLSSGKHIVAVRAVDLNRQYSSKPLMLDFYITTPMWRSPWAWGLLAVLGAGIFVWMLRSRELARREAYVQQVLNQKKMAELELQALKSQINPHFIFNCLNSIKMLNHKQQYSIAENYMDRFAALLRSALEQSSLHWISLQQEIEFIENYLALEKLRFPNRLFYKVEKDSGLDDGSVMLPSMLLQPCIENAIRHGIMPLKDRPGIITIRFKKEGDMLVAEVEDNGVGIDANDITGTGKGIGIMNTRRRSLFYDIEYSIVNLNSSGAGISGTLVRLMLPMRNYEQHTTNTR